MQKDIQKSKGETTQKFENQPFSDKPSVTETTGHKLKEVGHDINANLKENLGVGVGNYPSTEDRLKSNLNQQQFQEKKEQLVEGLKDIKDKVVEYTEPVGHKISEVAHNVNYTLKQNVGIGFGNYSSDVDQQISQEHKEKYDEKIQPVKQQVEAKTDEIKSTLQEKKEVFVEKVHEGTTGLYAHRIEEVAHIVNAKLKETIGIGIGDYSSDVDRQKAEEHWDEYMERVKETSKPEVGESIPIVHKIKEVAHNVNANLKELIGVGVGNYSSEVDRELSQIHHQKYEEKKLTTSTAESAELSGSSKSFEQKKEKLEGKLFPKAELRDDQPKKNISLPKKEADEKEKQF